MQFNHVAVFVDNLEHSPLAPALGGWNGPITIISEQPCLAAGRPATISARTRPLRIADPAFGVAVEDAVPGGPILPVPGNAWHHIAIWSDDLPGTVAALEDQGYSRDVVGLGLNGELQTFAYMTSPHGPRIEIDNAAMRARIIEHNINTAADAAASHPTEGAPSAPFPLLEVATVVATIAELERLQLIWERALGVRWGETNDSTGRVWTKAGMRDLRMRRVSSLAEPRLTILAPDQASQEILAPVAPDGWHHVGLGSIDLAGDIAWFEKSGMELEFCDWSADGQALSLAMMRTPDGIRIKLATQ